MFPLSRILQSPLHSSPTSQSTVNVCCHVPQERESVGVIAPPSPPEVNSAAKDFQEAFEENNFFCFRTYLQGATFLVFFLYRCLSCSLPALLEDEQEELSKWLVQSVAEAPKKNRKRTMKTKEKPEKPAAKKKAAEKVRKTSFKHCRTSSAYNKAKQIQSKLACPPTVSKKKRPLLYLTILSFAAFSRPSTPIWPFDQGQDIFHLTAFIYKKLS